MRLKIEGEITPERLARAVEIALEHLASADPDAKFYGANLYLNSYGDDGEAFDVVDDHQRPIMLRISSPAGGRVRPPLSAEAKQHRKNVREAKQHRELEIAELRRQQDAERQRKRQIEAAQAAKAQVALDALNVLTSRLLVSEPKALIDGFNGAIRASWHAQQPKETYGPRKGEPKPLPVFSTADGTLVLSTSAWKNPRWLRNAVGTPREGLIAPIWTYTAWITAVNGFLRIMESLGGSLSEEITRGPLWPELLSEI